jgi:ADP-L-glycero-D-manno-heptose 6-epimerase
MTLFFAEKGSRANGLFNLGSGEANTWLTLAGDIFGALGRPPNVEFIEMPEGLRAKYQYYTRADISKLRAAGYDRPVTPLAAAVTDYVANYLVPVRRLGEGV